MPRRATRDKSLGRSLVKARNAPRGPISTLHTVDVDDGGRTLVSITEASDLSEFLNAAVLADTDFTAERQDVVVLDTSSFTVAVNAEPSPEQIKEQLANRENLTVPRRPSWDSTTTPSQLDYNEREAFLEWRRELVKMEENQHLVLTPFEKNLEVWRQLWRVVERSDVVVQIVDARNPLLFRCEDLEKYVKEVGKAKRNVLVVNKADLLSVKQRNAWAAYFDQEGVEYIMFSAFEEKLKIEAAEKRERQIARGIDPDEYAEEEEKEKEAEKARNADVDDDSKPDEEEEEGPKIYNGEELMDYLFELAGVHTDAYGNHRRSVVGMVGYPNVGKSSTINVLMKQKCVAESATPGKTKHFQTLIVNEGLCLCDCPGLVFPSFMTTKAEMVCNGLLPIDQMRDHVGPISIVAQRIPRHVFHELYGIRLPKPHDHEDPNRRATPHEVLQAYGAMRGFMASHGSVDEPRSARFLLKDFVSGKLLYCHPPPNVLGSLFNEQNITKKDWKKFETATTDLVEEALVDMDIAPNRKPVAKKDRVRKGKRKLKRRHNGMGQDGVQAMVKDKCGGGGAYKRVQRTYNLSAQ